MGNRDFLGAGAAEDSGFAVSRIEHEFVLSDGWTFSPVLSSFSFSILRRPGLARKMQC